MNEFNKPDFLIIGAQKSGTSWLWDILKQHPGTDLNIKKEIFFFSSSKNYRKGLPWYYSHFQHLDSSKLIGEASTDYFYDNVLIDNLRVDHTLPQIPELIMTELPKIKILIILRDPVRRAISAYYHHMRNRVYSPDTGLREAAESVPRLRIIERGHYTRYLSVWKSFISQEQLRCYILENDVIRNKGSTIKDAYQYLDLDPDFKPVSALSSQNKMWGWTHIVLNYKIGSVYGKLYKLIRRTPLGSIVDSIDFLEPKELHQEDINYLRDIYLPQKGELEELIEKKLNYWDYGARLLEGVA
jgi:hypothetical protein